MPSTSSKPTIKGLLVLPEEAGLSKKAWAMAFKGNWIPLQTLPGSLWPLLLWTTQTGPSRQVAPSRLPASDSTHCRLWLVPPHRACLLPSPTSCLVHSFPFCSAQLHPAFGSLCLFLSSECGSTGLRFPVANIDASFLLTEGCCQIRWKCSLLS